jgi:hypothetical protein
MDAPGAVPSRYNDFIELSARLLVGRQFVG